MEIKNIDKAKELIPQIEVLQTARKMLSEDTTEVVVRDSDGNELNLPKSLRLNIVHVANCEYERIRKEVEGL